MTTKKTKIVLSLGRLHPLKGLDLLISAWAGLEKCANARMLECGNGGSEEREKNKEERGERSEARGQSTNELMNYRTNELLPWQLIIAGPDEQGTKEKLEETSKKLKMKIAEVSDLADAGDADIVFMGPVQGEAKWDLIKKADIFVLPSRSENFGIVVGEALSCGVPVVTTAVGPWGERGEREKLEEREKRKDEREMRGGASCSSPVLMEKKGLIVVETSVEGIAQGLMQMMALSDDERHALGQQGCEWVKREFSWERVAKQMVEAYEEGRAAARPYRGGINEPRGLSVGRGEL